MTRITLTTALIGFATTAAAHHENAAAHSSMDLWGFAVVAGLAMIGLPLLRKTLRK